MASDRFQETLQRWYGYPDFRGCQRETIARVMAGEHALLIAPTGSGKSLAYQIPALLFDESRSLTLVLSPLIALMKDQVDALNARGIDAAFVNSSLTADQRETRYRQIAKGQFRLLYVTPERFRKAEFLEVLRHRTIRLLAVDEAHCISQWGHDFRPDYSRLAEIRQHTGDPTTLFLTATATPAVRDDIIAQMGGEAARVQVFHEGIDRPNLSLDVREVWDEAEKVDAIAEVIERWQPASGIVYTTLIKTLERISESLRQRGIAHVQYHGQLPRTLRRDLQDAFLSNAAPTVIATNAFGMGIDKEDIRYVVHAEAPGSIESYYQEVGRAGRDGKPSQCVWLYQSDDLSTQMQFLDWRNPDADFFHRTHHFLTQRSEQVRGFGQPWLSEQLQAVSRHDHRLDTVLALFDRHGVVAGPEPPACWEVVGQLPDDLVDEQRIAAKRLADQQRLYALVEFARCDPDDRQAFLRNYFHPRPDNAADP